MLSRRGYFCIRYCLESFLLSCTIHCGAVRRAVPHALFIIQLEDIIFWLGVGAASYWLMFSSNYGEIRGFCLLGLGLGALVYGCTLGRFFVKGLSVLLRTLIRILALPWKGIGMMIQKIRKIFRKKKKTH